MDGGVESRGDVRIEDLMPRLIAGRKPLVLVLGSLLLAVLVSLLLVVRGGRRSKSSPPVVATIPIIGGLLKFVKGPIIMLAEEYARLGSVFTVKVLTRNVTFLVGPEVSAHFFKAQEADMSQKEVYQFNVPTFGPGVVFDVDYSVRMEQFRFFTEALTVKRLKSYVDFMVEEAELFFSKWGESGEVDLKLEFEHLIILTASRCLLGQEVRNNLFENVSSLFHDLDNGMLPISVLFPYLPIPAHWRRDRARKDLAKIFSTIIRNRKVSGKLQPDMLQAFIDSKYRSLGRSTTEEECTGLLIAALFAGQHTSSITSTWTGAYLMSCKQYMPPVLAEQKAVMQRHGNKLNFDVLSEMDVLHRSMKEALRLHPPLILLLRYCHTDFSVTTREGKTYTIPKDHIVATSPAFANRLPYIYKDPNTFNPDRFAPGREEDTKAGPFSYISFGGGRHGCLGETFAYMQVKTIWSIVLRHFELELISPFPEIDWNAMVVGVKGKVMVRYKRRPLLVD
jgi:sterol 14-demethylase